MTFAPEQWFGFVVTFVSGGLAGAIVTQVVTAFRQRRELALKTFDKYLVEFGPLANCKRYLAEGSYQNNESHFNEIRRLGDWFEVTAILCRRRYIHLPFIRELGLVEQLRKYHELITDEKNKPGSLLNDAWLWWPTFDQLIRRK